MGSADQLTRSVSQMPSEGFKPKSLNISVRRRDNERIERENHAFAKRLFSNSGSISKSALDRHYQEQLKLKNRISKVKKNRPVFQGRFGALPALTSPRQGSKTNGESGAIQEDNEELGTGDSSTKQLATEKS